MRKYTIIGLLLCAFTLICAPTYAKNSNTHNPPPRPQPNVPPNYYEDEYDVYNDYRLTEAQKIERIEEHLAAHQKLNNGVDGVEFRRKAILRLIPAPLQENVLKVAYERNGLFESEVKKAIKQMKKDLEYAGKDVKTKKFGFINVDIVE